MSATLLKRLLDAPDLPQLVEQATAQLQEEIKRRQAFREWVTPGVKAEFINGEVILHSPVKRGHLRCSGNLFKLLDTFVIPHSATRGDFCRFLFSPCIVANTRRSYATPAFCALQAKKTNLSKFHL
jgi:hypothetical protein